MDIIPFPASVERQVGEFRLTPETVILADSANQQNADYLRALFSTPTGLPLQIQPFDRKGKNSIRLCLDRNLRDLGPEGYRLEVLPEAVIIEASETTGVFHGIQTLRQLLPVEIEARVRVSGIVWQVPCVLIEDKPRFSWRGFMLDEGRHFQGKETVMLTLDLMALQKLNVFHWHLTEDQGWRIEIKKYPQLTEIGSQRAGTSKTMLGRKHDGIPHGGFYTQDEIREIVAYATARQIMIVPEIEMPGHSLAALASYPGLSCIGGPFEVATHFGIFPDIFCAGKESTFEFLQDILDEILELFPSPYIHIGGDEAPKKRWRQCPDCQKRIKEQGLKDEHELQAYFTNRIAAYLDSKGRHIIGWNEILEKGLASTAVVQFWLGNKKKLVEAVRQGRKTVMSTYLNAYLDQSYDLIPLSNAYRFEPIPKELDKRHAVSILGTEFPLWTEWVPNHLRLDYQVYPRLTAMAETTWTLKDMKDDQEFNSRLRIFLKRLTYWDINYAPLSKVETSKIRHAIELISLILLKILTIK